MKDTTEDVVLSNFGNSFMDDFHDYPSIKGLWRYQHRCRVDVIDSCLSRYCKKSIVGLDAGSGKGPSTVIMSRYLKEIHSIEYEQSNVDRQKINFKNSNLVKGSKISIKQGDLTNVELKSELADMIVCSEVLEHIDDYESAAAELYRVSKPGGTVIFSMPNGLSAFWLYDRVIYFLVKFVRYLKRKPMDTTGYSYWERSRHWAFSSKDIRKIVSKPGFKIVEERGISALVCNEWIYSHLVWGKFFMFIHKVETFLGKKIPRICGIYFLVLVKPNNPEDAK